MPGRVSALSLPIEQGSSTEFRSYSARTPFFTLSTGRMVVTLTLPTHLRPEHVEFARGLARQAAKYAAEVERIYRNGNQPRSAAC